MIRRMKQPTRQKAEAAFLNLESGGQCRLLSNSWVIGDKVYGIGSVPKLIIVLPYALYPIPLYLCKSL